MKSIFHLSILGALVLVPPIPKFNYLTPDAYKKAEIEAKINDIDPVFYKAILKTESAFKSHVTSKAGAKGMAQLMPEVVNKLGVKDPYNAHESIQGGARWLAEGVKEIGKKDYRLLAKWYNCGMTNLKKNPNCGNDYWAIVQKNMKGFS